MCALARLVLSHAVSWQVSSQFEVRVTYVLWTSHAANQRTRLHSCAYSFSHPFGTTSGPCTAQSLLLARLSLCTPILNNAAGDQTRVGVRRSNGDADQRAPMNSLAQHGSNELEACGWCCSSAMHRHAMPGSQGRSSHSVLYCQPYACSMQLWRRGW